MVIIGSAIGSAIGSLSIELFAALRIVLIALLNRARGSKLSGLTTSTVLGRVVCTLAMAISAACAITATFKSCVLWLWFSLMIWCTPAWDNYWSAAIGNLTDVNKKSFAPVDWLMKKIPYFSLLYAAAGTNRQLRLWGLAAMTLRQLLVVPAVAGYAIMIGRPERAIYAVAALLMGLPYYACGYLCKKNPIAYSELSSGFILGAMLVGVGYGEN
jgi:hypothetical protein